MPLFSRNAVECCLTIFILTVFGYLRNIEKMTRYNIPLLIKYLCLSYYNDGDRFDKAHCGQKLERTNFTLTQKENLLQSAYTYWMRNNINSTCWMSNTINKGVYLWLFEIKIEAVDPKNTSFRNGFARFTMGIYEATESNWNNIEKVTTGRLFNNYGNSYVMDVRHTDVMEYNNNESTEIGPRRAFNAEHYNDNHYFMRILLDMTRLLLIFQKINDPE